MRATVFEMLDAASVEDWPKVRRLSNKLMHLGTPGQKDSATRLWCAQNRAHHPATVAWIEAELRERRRAEDRMRQPIYTTSNPFAVFR